MSGTECNVCILVCVFQGHLVGTKTTATSIVDCTLIQNDILAKVAHFQKRPTKIASAQSRFGFETANTVSEARSPIIAQLAGDAMSRKFYQHADSHIQDNTQ